MTVIIDKYFSIKMLNTIDTMKIKYIKSIELKNLYDPVNTHPDMQIHFVAPQIAFVAPSVYDYYRNLLSHNIELYHGHSDPGDKYPHDCSFNIARIGKNVIGNTNYMDINIKDYYLQEGYNFINTKQGYTKCNLCIIDDNSAITEDEGLYKTLSDYGLDILKINAGGVGLSNFPHGFIGGASGKLNSETICFCGNIQNLYEYNTIKDFIESKRKRIVFLSNEKIFDYGSVLDCGD